MSILDVSKCKNSYITSILDKKSCVDDITTLHANIFNIFLANLSKTYTYTYTLLIRKGSNHRADIK